MRHGVTNLPLPYGIFDLDTQIVSDPGPPHRMKCFVQGCDRVLRTPSRGDTGETCPEHSIRCHKSPTYTYRDARRNIIASPDLFAEKIIRHPFKFESWRMGNECSEDALTWNVFRSFQEAGSLHLIVQWITGRDYGVEPELYLWGIRIDEQFEPFDLLVAARERFERRLPVKRPATEPDILVRVPGRCLILIEAKFTSENPCYIDGPRQNAQSLTKAELLNIYQDLYVPILDIEAARAAERIFPQLWRNMTFAGWMAMTEGRGADAYHVNLTRRHYENHSCEEFAKLLRPGFEDRFVHMSWEDIFTLSGLNWRELGRLQEYMMTKTARLQPAFQLGIW